MHFTQSSVVPAGTIKKVKYFGQGCHQNYLGILTHATDRGGSCTGGVRNVGLAHFHCKNLPINFWPNLVTNWSWIFLAISLNLFLMTARLKRMICQGNVLTVLVQTVFTLCSFLTIDFNLIAPHTAIHTLLRCQARHLQKFREKCPEKELFDLSANVDKRKRVELKDRTGAEILIDI